MNGWTGVAWTTCIGPSIPNGVSNQGYRRYASSANQTDSLFAMDGLNIIAKKLSRPITVAGTCISKNRSGPQAAHQAYMYQVYHTHRVHFWVHPFNPKIHPFTQFIRSLTIHPRWIKFTQDELEFTQDELPPFLSVYAVSSWQVPSHILREKCGTEMISR